MIRRSNKDDMDHIIEIWLNASVAAHNFIQEEYWKEKMGEMRDIYLPKAVTFIYEDEITGKVEGFISVIDNYIAALFVDPLFQQKGIGRRLLEYVKVLSPHWVLKVYSENRNAVNFYLNQGFIITEEGWDECTGHKELTMEYRYFR